MGRFKSVEIKGLLFEDFEKSFLDSINKVIKSSTLSEEETLKKLAPKFDELLSSYEETISTLYLQNHKFNLDNFIKIHCRNQKKLVKAHRDSFEAFILYMNGCYVVYEKIMTKLKRKKIDSTLVMTVALYGLIIRRADEILTLLLCGYIDGAMIVWRSFYENAIILLLLAFQNDNDLSDKYYQHSIRNSKKKILSYQNNHKELKFPSLPLSTVNKIQSEIEKVEAKYGKDFLNNEYGWADSLFPGKQKASFRLLEEKVEMNRFRPYYLLCSEHIHPSFTSFRNYMEGNKIILPKLIRQDIDHKAFIDPMQFTVSILHEVNEYILYEFSSQDEHNVNVLLMEKAFEKQQKTFDKPKRKSPGK